MPASDLLDVPTDATRVLRDRLFLLEAEVIALRYGVPRDRAHLKVFEAPSAAEKSELSSTLARLEALVAPRLESVPPEIVSLLMSPYSDAIVHIGNWSFEGRLFAEASHRYRAWTSFEDEGDIFALIGAREELAAVMKPAQRIRASLRWFETAIRSSASDLIWVSNALERLSLLQGILLLESAFLGLAPGGVIAGFFSPDVAPFCLDPRRVQVLSEGKLRAMIEASRSDQSPSLSLAAGEGGLIYFVVR